MEKIGIISNNQNIKAVKIAKKIYDYLLDRKNEIFLLKDDTLPQKYLLPSVLESEFNSEIELLISVGGDGTFLRASQHSFKREIPIMGVNVGNLGFLAEIDIANMYSSLDCVLNNKYKIEERMLIEGRLYRNGKIAGNTGQPYLALNEFVVSRPIPGKVIKIEIIVNEENIMSFSADGIIVATPTGSTAYSMSAGGPIVEPKSKVIIVTPICAHTVYNRSMVLSPDNKLEIKVNSKNKSVILNADGVDIGEAVQSNDIFRIKKSKKKLKLIIVNKNIFFKIFKEKLLGKKNAI